MRVTLICGKCNKSYETKVHGNIQILIDQDEEASRARKVDNGFILFPNEVCCPSCSSHLFKASTELYLSLITAGLTKAAKTDNPNLDLEEIIFATPTIDYLGKEMAISEGLVFFKQKLKKNPQDAELHLRYANVLRWMNFYNDAIKHYLLAIKYQENNAFAHYSLGQIYFDRNEYEKALIIFSKIKTLPLKQRKMKNIIKETNNYLADLERRIPSKRRKKIIKKGLRYS